MESSMLMVIDDREATRGGEHEPRITLGELQRSANRVQVLAQILWTEVQDYDNAYQDYREQWHRDWENMTKEEQDTIPREESLAHLELPRIGITDLGRNPLASVHLELRAPPSASVEIETVWQVRCPACRALPGFSCTNISGERRHPHEAREEEYRRQNPQ